MTDVEFAHHIEQIDERGLARERAGRQRSDEFLRRLGHDDAHRGAALLQSPDQIERLVGRNPAADDQQYALGSRFG